MHNLSASCRNQLNLKEFGCLNQSYADVGDFCCPITLEGVRQAVFRLKSNKAYAVDEILGEVLKNTKVVAFLHTFFNICFETGKNPETWSRCIINPIPKA